MNPQDAQEIPEPIEFEELLFDFIVQNIRGPAFATLFSFAIRPFFSQLSASFLASGHTETQLFCHFTSRINFVIRIFFFVFSYLEKQQQRNRPPTSKEQLHLAEFLAYLAAGHFFGLPLIFRVFRLAGLPTSLSPLPPLSRVYLHFAFASIFHILASASMQWLIKKRFKFGTHFPLQRHVNFILYELLPTVGGCFLCSIHPLVLLVWLAWRIERKVESSIRLFLHGTLLQRLGITNIDRDAFLHFHKKENIESFGSEFADQVFAGAIDRRWLAIGRASGYMNGIKERQLEEERRRQYQNNNLHM